MAEEASLEHFYISPPQRLIPPSSLDERHIIRRNQRSHDIATGAAVHSHTYVTVATSTDLFSTIQSITHAPKIAPFTRLGHALYLFLL